MKDSTKHWGGKRKGSGRKPSELGKTVVMRVPESRVDEIKEFIRSVNNQNIDYVNLNSTNKEFILLLEKWDALITPDRLKQPRWENAAHLLNELKEILK